MGIATLGGYRFRTGPDEISWDYRINVSDSKGLGGKVIQVLGSEVSNMRVRGRFSGSKRQEDWQEQLEFRERVKGWARGFEGQRNPDPIRFTYPPRNWDFRVYIKNFSPVKMTVSETAPEWELELFLVDEASRRILATARDAYVRRLLNGVGWSQTAYNGGSENAKARILSGRSVADYLADMAEDIYEGRAQ